MMMNLWKSIFAISALCVAVAACEPNAKFKEDMLSSAGFKPTPPSTPAQPAASTSTPHASCLIVMAPLDCLFPMFV